MRIRGGEGGEHVGGFGEAYTYDMKITGVVSEPVVAFSACCLKLQLRDCVTVRLVCAVEHQGGREGCGSAAVDCCCEADVY
jgi:hypothetical protein